MPLVLLVSVLILAAFWFLAKRGSGDVDAGPGRAHYVESPEDADVLTPLTSADLLPYEASISTRLGAVESRQQLEAAFAEAYNNSREADAVELGSQYLTRFRNKAFPASVQAWLALALVRRARYGSALHAFERYLAQYPFGAEAIEMKLNGALVYRDYAKNYARAAELLSQVADSGDSRCAPIAQKELDTVKRLLDQTVAMPADSRLLEGPCTIIRQTHARINIMDVGRLIADELKVPLVDVTGRIRRSVGILASGVDPLKARRLAAKLQQKGIPVLVVPDKNLVDLPPAKYARAGVFSDTRASFILKGDKTVERPWDLVSLITCGTVSYRTQKEIRVMPRTYDAPMVGPYGMRMTQPRKEIRVETKSRLVADFFLLSPYERIRMREQDYLPWMERAETRAADYTTLRAMLRQVAVQCGRTRVDRGVQILSESRQDWRGLDFSGERSFDQYSFWQLQLAEFS